MNRVRRRKRSRDEIKAIFAKDRFPHQIRVVQRLSMNSPRLLAYHSLGSGKTKTGLLAAQEALQKPKAKVLFITPAGLTKNIPREQVKHGIKLNSRRINIHSYEKAARLREFLQKKNFGLVVVDEAHKLREKTTKRYKSLEPVLSSADKVLLLSGSPTYHEPTNLSTLVNLLAKEKILPDDPIMFEQKFISRRYSGNDVLPKLRNKKKLKEILSRYVDYYEPEDVNRNKYYPRVIESTVRVPLSTEQQRLYNYFEERLPKKIKVAVRNNLPLDKRDSADLNRFSSGVRQVSNSTAPFTMNVDVSAGTKIDKAVSSLSIKSANDSNFRGLVYSNYLGAGIVQYKDKLDRLNIPSELLTGQLSVKQREEIVKKYNDGKIKVLLISSAGGEGLDLKGTKLVQVLDPHWNEEKIKQVVGRAVRYKSHEHLPEEQRQVIVEHYLSTVQPTLRERLKGITPSSIDEYLYNKSKVKSKINIQLKNLLKEIQQRKVS